MGINDIRNDDVFVLAQTLLKMMVGKNIATQENIDEVMNKITDLHSDISKEQLELTRRRIEASIHIDMGLGDYITDNSHKPWFINFKADKQLYYWERYRTLLTKKGFVDNVIMKMDNVSDKIVDLVGNPSSENMFSRRGLVVGDVQSGKTANYISVIAKAADAGYKVIILLAGTLNTLRGQTQERIDEGFIGVDSSKLLEKLQYHVGVGNIDSGRRPLSVTTLDSDFSLGTAKKLQVQLNNYKEPAIFVIKKNVSVLSNLIKWFDSSTNELQRSKLPLLIIDDEADYASVNTKDDYSPTKTNEMIRRIISMFPKVSYSGFTATPFANVFINPNTPEEMFAEDLFPENYIYVLDSPTNYIGPDDFFNSNESMFLEEINDMDAFLPHKHKIDHELGVIPSSLKEAILVFLITNAIRDMRGDLKSHRTMLVNVSRFTSIQDRLAEKINEIVYVWQRILKQYDYETSVGRAKDLYEEMLSLYSDKFSNTFDYSEKELLSSIRVSSQKVIVTAVNTNNKADNVLNYKQNKENGLRVIAVGGITLSRGLTLEGLNVSYFYRNSKYYDTLMQMGRWFGYRPGYDDLCRVYMSETAMSWYGHISEATDELKQEVKLMNNMDQTPREFGLKVMSHPTTLLVTAPNKLKNSSTYYKSISLSEQVIETPRLHNNAEINKYNFSLLEDFTSTLLDRNSYSLFAKKNPLFKNIDKEVIIKFIGGFKTHISNLHFQSREICEYINSNNGELERWDVVFVNGSSEEIKNVKSLRINPSIRKFSIREKNIIQISGRKNKLGSATTPRAGLSEEEIKRIREKHKRHNEKLRSQNKKTVGENATMYTRGAPNRNPLLMVYIVKLFNEGNEYESELQIDQSNVTVGIALAFPKMDDYKNKHFVEYKMNQIYYEQMFFDFDDYSSEDELYD